MRWACLAERPLLRRMVRKAMSLAPESLSRIPPLRGAGVKLRRFASPRSVFGTLPFGSDRVALFVSHELSATGAPKALLEIIRAAQQCGWKPIVVAPEDGPYRAIFVDAGVLVVLSPDALSERSPACEIAEVADIAVCNTIVTAGVVRAVAHLVPVAWYIHETGLVDSMVAADPSLSLVLRSAAVIWVASESAAEAVRRAGATSVVLGATCDSLLDAGAPLPPFSERPGVRAGVFASIEPRKGQDLLLEALRAMPAESRKGLTIDLYGRPLDESFASRVFAGIDAVPEVRYGGLLTPVDSIRAILSCDLVLVPSRDEPLPLVAIEALSAGRIVVCSRRCGISHYLTNGVDAFIAADCAPEPLAAAIESAFARRDDWPQIARAGRDVYERHFSPNELRCHVGSTLREAARRA